MRTHATARPSRPARIRHANRVSAGGSARLTAITAGAAGVILLAAPPSAMADDQPQHHVVAGYAYAGSDALFPDELDHSLRGAVEMLPARIMDYVNSEAGEDFRRDVPPEIVALVMQRLAEPSRAILTSAGFDPDTGEPVLGAVLSLAAESEQQAAELARFFELLREEAGAGDAAASQEHPGMRTLHLPVVGPLHYGPRRGAQGWSFDFVYGDVTDPDAPFALLPTTAAGVRGEFDRVFAATFDLASVSPYINMVLNLAELGGPPVEYFRDELTCAGLVGPEAIAVDVVSGFTETHGVEAWTIRRARPHAAALSLPTDTLDRADLRVIPESATAFTIATVDADGTWDEAMRSIDRAARAFGGGDDADADDVIEKLNEALGFDIYETLIEPIGGSYALYVSDATGGGGILSAVFIAELDDPAPINRVIAEASRRANAELEQEARGPAGSGVELRTYATDVGSITAIVSPGLPVPIVPTLITTDRHLIVAASPQAALGAAQQAAGSTGSSVLDNDAFDDADVDVTGSTSITFVDSARTIRDGYATASLLANALGNFVRTTADPNREAGLVLPAYNDVVRDPQPVVARSFWAGEDYVTLFTADRSTVVNASAILGVGDAAPLIGGAILGAAAAENND